MKFLPRKENPIFHFWKILWTLSFVTIVMSIIVGFFSLNTGYTGMTPAACCLVVAAVMAVFLPIYTLPSYYAFRKRLPQRRGLLICNLLLGWSLIGYIIVAVKVGKAKMED